MLARCHQTEFERNRKAWKGCKTTRPLEWALPFLSLNSFPGYDTTIKADIKQNNTEKPLLHRR